MPRITTLLLAATITVATPALAAAKSSEPVVTAATVTPVVTADANRRYCVEYDVTGLRIERRDCRTLERWLSEGFDPRAAD